MCLYFIKYVICIELNLFSKMRKDAKIVGVRINLVNDIICYYSLRQVDNFVEIRMIDSTE
jgi:hypothetical protein